MWVCKFVRTYRSLEISIALKYGPANTQDKLRQIHQWMLVAWISICSQYSSDLKERNRITINK